MAATHAVRRIAEEKPLSKVAFLAAILAIGTIGVAVETPWHTTWQ